LFDDENGFVVSAELIRVSTIVALGLSVGLVEVLQVSSELLEDLASVAGSMNQSYSYAGLMTKKACFSVLDFPTTRTSAAAISTSLRFPSRWKMNSPVMD